MVKILLFLSQETRRKIVLKTKQRRIYEDAVLGRDEIYSRRARNWTMMNNSRINRRENVSARYLSRLIARSSRHESLSPGFHDLSLDISFQAKRAFFQETIFVSPSLSLSLPDLYPRMHAIELTRTIPERALRTRQLVTIIK